MSFHKVYICPVCSLIGHEVSLCRRCLQQLVELTPAFQDSRELSMAVQSAARMAHDREET